MEVSDSFAVKSFMPREGTMPLIEQEVPSAPEPIWRFFRKQKL
jgi:hypothetical protein